MSDEGVSDAAFHQSWCAVIDLLDRDYITPAKLRAAIAPYVAAQVMDAERERDALREALGMAAFRLATAAPYQNTTEQTATVREWAKAARAALTANHSAPVVEE